MRGVLVMIDGVYLQKLLIIADAVRLLDLSWSFVYYFVRNLLILYYVTNKKRRSIKKEKKKKKECTTRLSRRFKPNIVDMYNKSLTMF